MWGAIDDSAEEPLNELWGLFKPDGDVSWQHKALCAQTDPEAFFPEKVVRHATPSVYAPNAKSASNA